MGHYKQTAFIIQTVLFEAPYWLASLYYIHAQHENSLPFIYITLLLWSKELAEVLCVGHVHTTSACYLSVILKYVMCR